MSLLNYKRRAEAVHFEGEVFDKMDLRSMKAYGSTWKNCTFNECELDLTDWRGSRFEGCTFSRCAAQLVNFGTSFFENTHFTGCNLEQASFMGSHFREVTFNDCRMAYGETMFQDATCKGGVAFHGCNLHGSNLDFREVEPKALRFDGCNLWGVKLGMACEFWNSTVDDRTVRQFLALVARVSDDPRIAELAGDQMAVVRRAMDGRKGPCIPASTTSPATTSSQIPNSPDLTVTTPTPILKAMMRTD